MAKRLAGAALLVTLMPWCAGCATETHLRQALGGVEGASAGRLLVRVFEKRSDRDRDISTHRKIVTELYRVEGRAETFVRVESEPRWTAPDLPPGKYLLVVSRWLDDMGVVHKLSHVEDRRLVIRANRTTVADVVLSDSEKAYAGLGIAVGIIALLAYFSYELQTTWGELDLSMSWR